MELGGVRVRSSFLLVAALGVATLPLGGCDSFNRAIGKTRVIPDEFQVVSNAPLAIPPDYTLRPPRVGSGPEQANPTDQARETVFRAGDSANGQPAAGAPSPKMSAGEQDLLRQAGATTASSDIRRTVDADPTEGVPFERSLVDKLLFWSGPTTPASNDTLNPGEEASRIRVAQSVAKPGGPTAPPPADAPVPTFEHGQKKSGWFSWF
jgi:hypothetical protein